MSTESKPPVAPRGHEGITVVEVDKAALQPYIENPMKVLTDPPLDLAPRGLTTYLTQCPVCGGLSTGAAGNSCAFCKDEGVVSMCLAAEVDARLAEGVERWGADLQDYRNAPGGDGPHAAEWADKPHRLVYDLCEMVQQHRDRLAEGARWKEIAGAHAATIASLNVSLGHAIESRKAAESKLAEGAQELERWKTCENCGEKMDRPGVCAKAVSEREKGLELMHEQTLQRAEQAEAEVERLRAELATRYNYMICCAEGKWVKGAISNCKVHGERIYLDPLAAPDTDGRT